MNIGEKLFRKREKAPQEVRDPLLEFNTALTKTLGVADTDTYDLTEAEEASFSILLSHHVIDFIGHPEKYAWSTTGFASSNTVVVHLDPAAKRHYAEKFPPNWTPPANQNFESTIHERALFNATRTVFRQLLDNLLTATAQYNASHDDKLDYTDSFRVQLINHLAYSYPAPDVPLAIKTSDTDGQIKNTYVLPKMTFTEGMQMDKDMIHDARAKMLQGLSGQF